jgi:hypothetical protein
VDILYAALVPRNCYSHSNPTCLLHRACAARKNLRDVIYAVLPYVQISLTFLPWHTCMSNVHLFYLRPAHLTSHNRTRPIPVHG